MIVLFSRKSMWQLNQPQSFYMYFKQQSVHVRSTHKVRVL